MPSLTSLNLWKYASDYNIRDIWDKVTMLLIAASHPAPACFSFLKLFSYTQAGAISPLRGLKFPSMDFYNPIIPLGLVFPIGQVMTPEG
jgi:hypothetical protein